MTERDGEGSDDAAHLRDENERLRAELRSLRQSLQITAPTPKPPPVAPEPERGFILVPLDTGKSPEFVRALSRIAVEGAAKAMPDRTWATITDAADVPAGSIVLHLGHVTEKMWGDIRNGDVPVYEIEAGEMRRLFNYDGGGEAFEAFFLMERAITFYETEAENSETPGVLREAWRLAGELTRASLSVARIHWESGDDEGEDSWRATYAGWQASERDLMAWLERGAAGQNAS